MEMIIEVENLRKSFPGVDAVDDASFEVRKGEIFGLIGPVGAGKSTLLRILSGIMLPTSGRVRVLGFELPQNTERIKQNIGYMSQNFSLYEDLTVEENIQFFGRMYLLDSGTITQRMPRLLEMTRLAQFAKRLTVNLSGGMKQKLSLVCTIIHNPDLLILDEPTTGIDPVSRREFWNILREIVTESITIVLSTPYMDEAEWCTKTGLLSHGKLLVCDSPKNLKNQFSEIVAEVSPTVDQSIFEKALRSLEGITEIQVFGKKYHIILRNEDHFSQVKSHLENVADMKRIFPSIEDIYVSKIRQ